MVRRYDYTDSLPKVPAQLFEGTRTEYTGQNDQGGEDTIGVYSAPINKGDLVKIKDHTTNGLFLVEKLAAGDNTMVGIVIDDPIGEDTVTATGGTPAAAQQRTATVAVFAMGVIDLVVSSTGAVSPGDSLGIDANEEDQVEQEVAYTSVDESDSGNALTALTYGTDGQYVACAIGLASDVTN